MHHLVSAALSIAAFIHLLPVSGLRGAEHLSRLYGVAVTDPNIELLLRHRAVLLGLLGLILLAGAFWRPAEDAALVAGLISTLSFLFLARRVGPTNPALDRVVKADIVAVVALFIGSAVNVLSGVA